jgi:hypothetical protein
MSLRAVIFGVEGIFFKRNKLDTTSGLAGKRREAIRDEVARLFAYLRSKDVMPIVLTNHVWTVTASAKKYSLDEYLTNVYGEHKLYVAQNGDVPPKPQASAVATLLEKEGLEPNEVIYVGMSDTDFKTAINSNLLFLNAIWDRQEVEYGFVFESPIEIVKFIDLFALRDPQWFYEIDDPIILRCLAPYSTFMDDTRDYSSAAEAAAKRATKDRHFFLNSVVASLYFTGLIQGVDYIAVIPGHEAGFGNPSMDDYLAIVGDIFRKKYLRDLIVRHTSAPSSREVRRAGSQPRPEVQFNTLKLTRKPLKKGDVRYASKLDLRGKTVLVFDDFCTNGMTFEAARHLLKQTDAGSIQVSWLKTINRGYRVVADLSPFPPYEAVTHDAASIHSTELPYSKYIVGPEARTELSEAFDHYKNWKSPV